MQCCFGGVQGQRTYQSHGRVEEEEKRRGFGGWSDEIGVKGNLHCGSPGDRLKVGNGQYAALSRGAAATEGGRAEGSKGDVASSSSTEFWVAGRARFAADQVDGAAVMHWARPSLHLPVVWPVLIK